MYVSPAKYMVHSRKEPSAALVTASAYEYAFKIIYSPFSSLLVGHMHRTMQWESRMDENTSSRCSTPLYKTEILPQISRCKYFRLRTCNNVDKSQRLQRLIHTSKAEQETPRRGTCLHARPPNFWHDCQLISCTELKTVVTARNISFPSPPS